MEFLKDILGGVSKLPITIIVIIIVLVAIIASLVKIVPESNNYVIEKLGVYSATWSSGLHFKKPFIERIAKIVTLKEQVVDFDPQSVITKDNVTINIDTIVFFQITDPKLYTYGVSYPVQAIENLAATTLRNIVGDLELDQTLTSRELINSKMQNTLDEATDQWGIKVNRVELKSITPPPSIMQAMELQMKAERDKRAKILNASAIKEASILKAEGEKQALILEAEAKKETTILNAEAMKAKKEIEAQGEANAILLVQEATAQGLEKIKNINIDEAVLKFSSLKSLEKVADGKSTKIIIPSDLKNLASTFVGVAETIKGLPENDKKPNANLPKKVEIEKAKIDHLEVKEKEEKEVL